MEIESKNIMSVYNLYKTFISNHLSDILDDDEKINEKLVTKYAGELKLKTSESSFAKNRKLKILIEQEIKDLAVCNLNDNTLTIERRHEISLMEQNGDILQSFNFRIMTKQLQLEKRLHKEELTTHIRILLNMWCHVGNGYCYSNKESKWAELFESAVDLYYVSNPLSCDRVDDDTYNLIKTTKYLERYNIQYEIMAGKVVISDNSHVQIHMRLEGIIKSLGGVDTLRILFNKELLPKYKKEMDRYLIHRNKSLTGENKDFKRVPYNYLINICGKFLNNGLVTLTSLGIESNYNEVIDLSSNYLTILQLQSSSLYEDMFIEYKKLPEYICKNMIFENLYIPVQYKPDFVLDILNKLYKPLCEDNCKEFTFNDYYKVASIILKEYTYCSTIKFEDLRVKLGLKRNILRNILNKIAEDKDLVNKDYLQILTPANLFDKPLIELSKDTYFMISSHFCGYSFCTVIHQILRKARVSNLDRDLGDSIEDYVKGSLNGKHIPYKSGHYSITKPEEKGQCDVVIETKKEIVFLEIKKRSLPDEFKLGDDVEVLRSLGDGMLNAQKQILRHRVYLQKNSLMKLYQKEKESSPYTVLDWSGRRIVSISLCLPEYGFLTNKTISSQLMESLIFATYHATDPAKEESLDKLNKLRDKIVQLADELRPEDKKDARTIFFDTLFRSLQQFMFVLEISSDVEELVDYLTREVYLIDGSLDFYTSLYFGVR